MSSLCMTSWLTGSRAIRSSRDSKRSSSSAAGAASAARPHSAAVVPSIESPVSSSRLARAGPTRNAQSARRRDAPDARRRIADLRLVLDDDQVRAERHVGAAGDAVAVHLADHRLVGVEQAHEAAQVAAHHLVVDDRVPGALRVVVAGLDHRVERRARAAPPDSRRPPCSPPRRRPGRSRRRTRSRCRRGRSRGPPGRGWRARRSRRARAASRA